MKEILTVLIAVTVAGFVGGVTNHLAIKMLFHPRQPIRIRGRRLPFTPGLIPKRKAEIGQSLGKVVAEHLVTTEGLASLLTKPIFVERVEDKLRAWVNKWAESEETIEQLAVKIWTPAQVEEGKKLLAEWLRNKTSQTVLTLWDRYEWSDLTLGGLASGWLENRRESLVERVAEQIIEQIKNELQSPNGEKMLRKLTVQFMEQAGGFLGTLAGIFMDEDKVAGKVRSALYNQLDSPQFRNVLKEMLLRKLEQLEKLTVGQMIGYISDRDAREWAGLQSASLLPWEDWIERGGGWQLRDLLGPRKEWVLGQVHSLTSRVLGMLAQNMERLVSALNLPALVEEEVEKFPVEQLENIILSVSGKEFRAITWLGVLLGGFIGLFQSVLMLWLR
ncbi:DUF445 family protein [Paenibacillus sp. J2TS4]|uniref:DUF445 family protein n=1 Tax=Paenibacillus sp. J2TS4 TaxID=2807194 RepID=UPI001B09D3C0|nr:DUF445 family protein [Paenibacillus sp. J2TS4]GIP33691.1 UPF0754 membrane protein [Paenibacillus sp. J2TS4]